MLGGLNRSMQHHLLGIIFLKVVFMAQGKRDRLSAAQRNDIWRRWKAGESLHEIGRVVGKDHGSIQFLLSQHSGIAPVIRHRSQRTLNGLASMKSFLLDLRKASRTAPGSCEHRGPASAASGRGSEQRNMPPGRSGMSTCSQ
jgi:hypothetical protein